MKKTILILFPVFLTLAQAQQISRFMVVGDTHHYSPSPDFTNTVLYEITLAAIDEQVDFVFFTGDLIVRGFSSSSEEDSVLKDWRFVLDTLYHHGIRVFACRGNNDVSSRDAWDSLFSGKYLLPQNGPEQEKNITYAIEYDNLLFIALDDYTENHKINQDWLDEILATKHRDHIFVAGHEPAFKLFNTGCLGAFPEDRNLFWESLISTSVKAYFSGHDHFYDHAIIDDGDDNLTNDVHQVITGTGGGTFYSALNYDGDNGRWTPQKLFHEENNGYVLVETDDSEIQMKWMHRVDRNVFEYGGDSYIFSSSHTDNNILKLKADFLNNFPNPFSSKTVISYQLSVIGKIELSIYDLTGRKVTSLIKEVQQPGNYKVEWNAEGIKPGIYFCKLKTDIFEKTVKLIAVIK